MEDKRNLIEGMFYNEELTLYFLLFSIMSVGVILANRKFGGVLEGGFKKSLGISALVSYIFIGNIALFYLLSMIVLNMGYDTSIMLTIGSILANSIQFSMILFMIMYLVIVAFYLKFATSFFKK